jgi:hypothetical protein
MEKKTAEKLMEIYRQVGEILNNADPIIRNIEDDETKKQLIRPLGEVMADLWIKLERPIVKMYPDLDPDKKNNKIE